MIAISQVGMVTSVGRDATSTFHSIVCGIARPRELGYFSVVEPDFQEPEGVTGHPIEALTEGFHLFGLWIRAGVACLEDLLERAPTLPPRGSSGWERTALIAVTPDIRSERFLSAGEESPGAVRAPFLDRIGAWLGIHPGSGHLHAVCAGRTGVFEAIETAGALLEKGHVDRVVVLAVDSLLDTLSLEWLAAQHRLKTPSNPAGLMPGECAAAMLLERAENAATGGPRVTVRSTSRVPASPGADLTGAERGRRLAAVLSPCLAALEDTAASSCVLVSDQNGEQWRAEELGHCQLHLAESWPASVRTLIPALSVGDTGAASAALACCLGALALRSVHAGARQSLVVASGIDGRAGAVLLSADG